MVYYDKIPGETVFTLTRTLSSYHILFDVLNHLSQLHQEGVYFRAIHLNNILYTPQQKFALIDTADVHIKNKPLSMYKRYRNLRHLLFYEEQHFRWQALGMTKCIRFYIQCANLNARQASILKYYFKLFCQLTV